MGGGCSLDADDYVWSYGAYGSPRPLEELAERVLDESIFSRPVVHSLGTRRLIPDEEASHKAAQKDVLVLNIGSFLALLDCLQ